MLYMMKPHRFNGKESVSLVGLLRNFRDECNAKNVHEGAEMLLMTQLLDRAPKDRLEGFMKSLTAKKKKARNQTDVRCY